MEVVQNDESAHDPDVVVCIGSFSYDVFTEVSIFGLARFQCLEIVQGSEEANRLAVCVQ